MDFNSERLIPKGKYFDQSNSGEISKDLNYNEIENQNENENDEDIQANLIFSWGFSKYGQTGIENANYILTPSIINFSQIINSEQFSPNIEIEIYGGESHSALLIKEQNQTFLYMFGKNIFGQLGFGENSYIFEPLLVQDIPEKIKKVSLGGEHSIILTTKNNIFVSGLNIFGQLGIGDYENRNIFTNINIYKNALKNKKDEKIIDIAAGAQHSLLLSNKNNIYYCKRIKFIRAGMNISGILFEDKLNIAIFGQDLEILNKSSEIILININDIIKEEYRKDNLLNISDIKLGQEFILILISNGDVYTCGINKKIG